jgi:Polysaccharide pyruvyl transferase.
MGERLAAFWCRTPSRPNFGDALTPWLVHRIAGTYPRYCPPDDPRGMLFVTGSIIALAGRGVTVWGSGIMNADDTVSSEVEILAVRGPRTRDRALAGGAVCPEVYGDPALLLPRLRPRVVRQGSGVGLAPHFSQRPHFIGSDDLPRGVRLIDMQAPIETVIDELCCCDLVAASSLHGLIVSHAYGIPAVWVEFGPLPSGDRTKFHDYLESVGREGCEPLQLTRRGLDVGALRAAAIEPPTDVDLDALWNACPFRRDR